MARLARAVAAGMPHHVTQRGNRRQDVFFCDADRELYIDLMADWCTRCGVEIWAYCLMDNHVHLIAVPEAPDGLARAIGEAHRRYTRHVNQREDWTGHLWQSRFASYAMDETHLIAAARYVERNPVEAGAVRAARDYRWSSARAHLAGRDDALCTVRPLLEIVPDWRALLRRAEDAADAALIEKHSRTGRPLGSDHFVAGLETALGRPLRKRKPGPKPNARTARGSGAAKKAVSKK